MSRIRCRSFSDGPKDDDKEGLPPPLPPLPKIKDGGDRRPPSAVPAASSQSCDDDLENEQTKEETP